MNDKKHRGLRVRELLSGNAERAGVQVKDHIMALDGKAVNSFADYIAAKEAAGRQYTLTILRGRKLLELTVEKSQ